MFTLDTCRSQISTDTIGRHLADSVGRYSTDISTDTRARYRPTLGRASVDMFFKLVDHPSALSVDTWSVCRSYTRPTPRPLGYDELSAAYRSTSGGILCVVNRLFC